MLAGPKVSLPQRWSTLDFGFHAFLVVNPFALGLWTLSMAPLVGGNLFVAVPLAGAVTILGAAVFGALSARWPWSGGDYAWQSRLLGARVGAVLALTAWWLVVALLAPVYGNVLLVEVLDPLLTHAGWNGTAAWFRGREGVLAASLLAIAVASAFVGLGMRRAALAQRVVVVAGTITLIGVLGLLLASNPADFETAFDEHATEVYDAGPIAHGQTLYLGTFDARVTDVDVVDTLRLVPLVLLYGLWIGWATPLAGEVRSRRPGSPGRALVRAAAASLILTLLLFVATARATNWEFWTEANNLYWGTAYQTTATALLPTWPNPVVFAAWLSDSTAVQILLIAGMSAWVVGWTATLFLGATRVLLAASSDDVLPRSVSRTTGDSVPVVALALLVIPACALAVVDAYSDAFATWTSVAVVALAVTTMASGIAVAVGFRRENPTMAVISAVFVSIVALVTGAWIVDPVFGMRGITPLAFLAALYALAGLGYLVRLRTSTASEPGASRP